jgi:hypothetical protein
MLRETKVGNFNLDADGLTVAHNEACKQIISLYDVNS